MSNINMVKVYPKALSRWRIFVSGLVMALDSYSPLPIDLAGWADPKRENTAADEEMIDKFQRDLLRDLGD